MFVQAHVRLRSPVTIAGKSARFFFFVDPRIKNTRISLHCRALPRIRYNPISLRAAPAIQPSWISRDVALGAKKIEGFHVKLARLRKRWAKNRDREQLIIPRIKNMVIIRKHFWNSRGFLFIFLGRKLVLHFTRVLNLHSRTKVVLSLIDLTSF